MDVPVATPLPPRSLAQLTCVMPNVSRAVPPSAIVRVVTECVGFDVGVMMATVGVSPSVRVIVKVSVADWPAASRAVTVMTLAPG